MCKGDPSLAFDLSFLPPKASTKPKNLSLQINDLKSDSWNRKLMDDGGDM